MTAVKLEGDDQWSEWSDEALIEYEASLYAWEVEGEDTWAQRDELLWEMCRRGLIRQAGHSALEPKPTDTAS